MKKILALTLLVASSVTAEWQKHLAPAAAILVAGEVMYKLQSKSCDDAKRSDCDSYSLRNMVKDIATAAVGSAAMMVAKRQEVNLQNAVREGITTYASLKLSQSEEVTNLCESCPGVRGLLTSKGDNNRISTSSLTRHALCYMVCDMVYGMAFDAAKNLAKH